MNKKCSTCGIEKPIDDFGFHNAKTGARRAQCKECHKIVKEAHRERVTKEKIEYILELKKDGCKKCGDVRPYIMDFHHLKREEKENNIAKLINRGITLETLKVELEKCILLCSNCHREFHFLEKTEKISIEDYLS